ncbi:MAG: MATE family efflux transporter [Bacillota bacterium]|nr:MATE family efflux transporter [Bacillota bacterium]
MKSKTRESDLTTGNLFWKIPLFAAPLAITTIFQLLYTTIDLWTVATFGGGSNSMSAIGSNSSLINLIITVFYSLALGANVAIGNAKGANDPERADKVLHTALVIAVLGGIFIGLVGYFIAPYLLEWMGTIDSIKSKAAEYLAIYFVGMPFVLIYNYGSQMLRALGDSKRPLYILTISGIINVAFDLIFVICFDMDVSGVAWATVMSEAVSAILTVLWLHFNKTGFVRLDFKKLKIDKIAFRDIIQIGLPAGIQGLAFSLPNVLIQSSLYTIGDYTVDGVEIHSAEIVAGAAAAAQIESYIFAIIDSFAQACVSFVGQNFGARKKENVKKTFWYCTIWMFICAAILAVICGFAWNPLLGIFLSDDEEVSREAALLAGRDRLYIMAFTYGLDGLMGIFGSYLRGMRRSTPPAIVTMIGCTGFRILFLYTFFQIEAFHTVFWLYAAFPISWILVNIAYIPLTLILEKRQFALIEPRPSDGLKQA